MERIPPGEKNIGYFKIESGNVRVSDPCYERDAWCSGVLTDVKKGTWNAYVLVSDEGEWGSRVKQLLVTHELYRDNENWKIANFEVGVDSGQAGIFDNKYYKDDSVVARFTDLDRKNKTKICEDEPWFSWCCDKTLGIPGGGVVPFGAVSSSGFGDGGYVCFFNKNKDGEIDAIKIVYIPDEDEFEETEDEEDESIREDSGK